VTITTNFFAESEIACSASLTDAESGTLFTALEIAPSAAPFPSQESATYGAPRWFPLGGCDLQDGPGRSDEQPE
jgi:hypothetical protein